MPYRGFPDSVKLGCPILALPANLHYVVQGKKESSMLTAELDEKWNAGQMELAPHIEDWRCKLERTCRKLLPWACSAQMLPLWVSDYGKVCGLASALNAKIDDLFSLTSQDLPQEQAANASMLAAIDQTVEEIGMIGRRIETELHDSIGVPDEHHRRSRSSLHRHRFNSI
jgi:hypothetical protein